jgi:GMP synthase-like glutamine amidotransferase
MIAHMLGAKVYPGKQKEIGWHQVALTDEGVKDPCTGHLGVNGTKTAEVFQWHGDTFDLPRGAVRLASSPLYSNQAFRYSDRVYALQFHIEVTPSIVRDWMVHEEGIDIKTITAESEKIFHAYSQRALHFYRQFFTPPENPS